MIDFKLRPAEPRDVPAIVGLITELAEFEHLAHLMRATPETLAPHLFGPRPVAESVVAEAPDAAGQMRVVGFALFFTNFSTFLGCILLNNFNIFIVIRTGDFILGYIGNKQYWL